MEERNERENLLAALPLLEQEADLYDKLFNFSALRQEANTADEKSASRLGSLSQKNSRTTKAKTRIFSYIARIQMCIRDRYYNPQDAQEFLLQEQLRPSVGNDLFASALICLLLACLSPVFVGFLK